MLAAASLLILEVRVARTAQLAVKRLITPELAALCASLAMLALVLVGVRARFVRLDIIRQYMALLVVAFVKTDIIVREERKLLAAAGAGTLALAAALILAATITVRVEEY